MQTEVVPIDIEATSNARRRVAMLIKKMFPLAWYITFTRESAVDFRIEYNYPPRLYDADGRKLFADYGLQDYNWVKLFDEAGVEDYDFWLGTVGYPSGDYAFELIQAEDSWDLVQAVIPNRAGAGYGRGPSFRVDNMVIHCERMAGQTVKVLRTLYQDVIPTDSEAVMQLGNGEIIIGDEHMLTADDLIEFRRLT